MICHPFLGGGKGGAGEGPGGARKLEDPPPLSRKLRPQPAPARARRRRRSRPAADIGVARLCGFVLRETGSAVVKVISFAVLLLIALLLVFDGTEIVLDRLDPRLKSWINARVAGPQVDIGSVSFSLGSGDTPAGLTFSDIVLAETETSPEIRIPSVETGFAVMDTLREGLKPQSVAISGATVSLVRGADGTLRLYGSDDRTGGGLVLGGTGAGMPDLSGFLDSLGKVQAPQMFGDLDALDIRDVSFGYADPARGLDWRTEGAEISLNRGDEGLEARIRAVFSDAGGQSTRVNAGFTQHGATGDLRVTLDVSDARPGDLASLLPALDWLRVVDAPVSGALAVDMRGDGAVSALSGTLSMAAGRLHPPGAAPVGFDSARVYFGYDPASAAFRIDELSIEGPKIAFSSTGRITATQAPDRPIDTLTGELSLGGIRVSFPEYLAQDLTYDTGALTARLSLSPFRLEIGEAVLGAGRDRVSLSGSITADQPAWRMALDARTRGLALDRGLALWPETLRPRLRDWIARNVTDGRLDRAQGFLRADAEGRELGFDFAFSGGRVRPLPEMPAIVAARGTGQMIDGRFELVLDQGTTGAGEGAGIDLSGSRMTIADARAKPSIARFDLRGAAPAGTLLALIDNPPLRLLSRAGRTPDLAQGAATATAELTLPLIRRITPG